MEHEVKKFKKAIAKGELFEYMVGEKGYKYVCPYADVPTYHQEVFDSIIEYVKESKDKSIWKYFESALLEISSDSNYSWFVLYYISAYTRHFFDETSRTIDLRSPVDMDKILGQIIKNMQANKKKMSQDQRWMGRGFSNGLWDNATRMATIINRDYDLTIQLE